MLTNEILLADEKLKELSVDQIASIIELSKNDENAAIATVTGRIHGEYDRDVKTVLGIDKPQGVKTYDWIKNDLLPKIKDADGLNTTHANELKVQMDKVIALEQAIANQTGDVVLTQQLRDANDKIAQLESVHGAEKETWTESMNTIKGETTKLRLNQEFDKGLAGIKFIDEKLIPKNVRDIVIERDKEIILKTFTPDFVDDGVGGTVLVFRDKDGTIQNNPQNGLKPYTAAELLMKQDGVKGVIDFGRQMDGGTGSNGNEGKENIQVNISSAKTQVEADELISKELMSKGLTRDSQEFSDQQLAIRTEYKVSDLPLK
jgi:hypothetical protein